MQAMTHSASAMAAPSPADSGLRGEDRHLFRVYKAYTFEARLVLFQVLSWGCSKPPSQTFDQYLTASGMSRTSFRKAFNGQQQEKMSRNPSGDQFDISLLYKMIQLACHSLASSEDAAAWTLPDPARLEYLLTHLKNSRNELMHDTHFYTQKKMVEKIETLRELLTQVVNMSGTLYCVNHSKVKQVLQGMNCSLNNIRDQPLAPLDLEDYRNQLLFDSLRATLRVDGARELKQIYSAKTCISPLSFLDKNECYLRVGMVFISLSIQDLKASNHCRLIKYQDLIEHIETRPSLTESRRRVEHEVPKPSLMIIEGQPGSGKTTLLRIYVSEWIDGGGKVKGLSDYDLVLHLESRDTCIESFTQLLLSHMPQTTSKFRRNDLLHIFLSLKTMVLVDGLDELNITSQKVFREILQLKSSNDFTLICTSRTEKIREVYKLASGRLDIAHMKILGIPIEKREEFVRLYHRQLKTINGVPQQEVDDLLDYLRQVPSHLQDFFKFPLNLVMLTFLWDSAHPRVRKINSMTELYLETHKLLIDKLLERLMHHPSTQHIPLLLLTTKCDSFLAVMYEEALRALAADAVYLDRRAAKRLRNLCVSLDLPAEEMFSAFLVSASCDHTPVLCEDEEVKFPHKGIQDFYAARHVVILVEESPLPDVPLFLSNVDELLRKFLIPNFKWRQIVKLTQESLEQPVAIRRVLLEFHEDHSKTRVLGRYQNIIFHMVNLLHSYGGHLLEHYAAEVVTLLAETKGMSLEHWADLLKEGHYNATLAEEISKELPEYSWTVGEGHMKAASAFLSHRCPFDLTIDIINDPEKVLHLHELLQTAATCRSNIHLFFNQHWRRPETGLSDSFLLKLVSAAAGDEESSSPTSLCGVSIHDDLPALSSVRSPGATASDGPRNRLVEVMGRFSGQAVHWLPSSLQVLRLAIADDHDALDWFESLPTLSHTLPSLRSISIHVAAGVCPDLLPCVPKLANFPRLYLSGVGDDSIAWASHVARALLLPGLKYLAVSLVRSGLSSRGLSQLCVLLRGMGVGVQDGDDGGVRVTSALLADSPPLTNVSKSAVGRYLKCNFALLNDDEIWNEDTIYEIYEECTYIDHATPNKQHVSPVSSTSSLHDPASPQPLYDNMYDLYVNLPSKQAAPHAKDAEDPYLYPVLAQKRRDEPLGSYSDEEIYQSFDEEICQSCLQSTQPKAPPLPPRPPPPLPPKSSSTPMSKCPYGPSSKTHTERPTRLPLPLPPPLKIEDHRSKPHRQATRPPPCHTHHPAASLHTNPQPHIFSYPRSQLLDQRSHKPVIPPRPINIASKGHYFNKNRAYPR
ncbi:NLR family CARD domain-containing protein 4 [Chionoecetes opilio]|uniref:NLR family CARD domain-containing protein 4 n=1 Tax=Chionoecetes opilio TaxID=41210 RepID=A0A8J4Y4Q1_CHIOP|nr:NLR family CARD domain-containing protein 4 [Chionoecetes opilio]